MIGIDPAAVLALISDLTNRLAAAEREVNQLRDQLPQDRQ